MPDNTFASQAESRVAPGSAAVRRYGTALIVSGPSGAGKTTACRLLLEQEPGLHFSVSCTTRAPRPGERDGRDYSFMTRPEFERHLAAGDFLEHAEVHGNFYGTRRREVQDCVNNGRDVLLDIDVQGAGQVRNAVTDTVLQRCAVFVFFAPPTFAELERRLRQRATDAAAVIARRLRNAKAELAQWRAFDYLVVNEIVETAVTELAAVLAAARAATVRVRAPEFDVDAAPCGEDNGNGGKARE